MSRINDKVPWSNERKEEIYQKIETGDYVTKETSEPNCRRIIDAQMMTRVGYICVKCGRVFSECSGGYRYQHIRHCEGKTEYTLVKRKPGRPKMKTVSLEPQNDIIASNQSFTNSVVNGLNGLHRAEASMSYPSIPNSVDVNTWLSLLSTKKDKENFIAGLSKYLLEHLPLLSAVDAINGLANCLTQSTAEWKVHDIQDSAISEPASVQVIESEAPIKTEIIESEMGTSEVLQLLNNSAPQ